jgi:signal transduction histidine kinase
MAPLEVSTTRGGMTEGTLSDLEETGEGEAEPGVRAGATRARRSLWVRLVNSLAGRLLGLTIAVVLFAEALLFTPNLARFHDAWLQDRVNLAQVAALALDAAPDRRLESSVEQSLLDQAQVKRIALRRPGDRDTLLESIGEIPSGARLVVYDYTEADFAQPSLWALETLFAPEGRVLRVVKAPRFDTGDVVDIVMNEAPLRAAVRQYAMDLLVVSTAVSVIAGALVYAILIFLLVRPMRRITQNVEAFRRRTTDASRLMPFTRRRDEIGRAQRAIRAMQMAFQANLRQRERLAALGGAVARISHDLRNMLATAQLVTQRIAESQDPDVRAAAPRLERAIGRAAGLAESAMRYGRAEEPAPVLQKVALEPAAREAFADALATFPDVRQVIGQGMDAAVIADPDMLHRIFANLMRNAGQALREAREKEPSRPCRITVSARQEGPRIVIEIADTGGGLPKRTLDRLFEPFSHHRAEGSGLGLAIARELAAAQGGELTLRRTGPEGAAFELSLNAA